MAINTSGYRIDLPPIATIPSNVGALDVGSGQQALLRGMQISKAAFGDPINDLEKAVNFRTLLARARQEDELRSEETKAKRARLLSAAALAPEEVKAAQQNNVLGEQRIARGAREAEVDVANQPTLLSEAKQKGEEVSFRSKLPVAQRVFGPTKKTEVSETRLPGGAIVEQADTTIDAGGTPYTLASTKKTGVAPISTTVSVSDAGVPGYLKETISGGGASSEKLIPSQRLSTTNLIQTIADLRSQAEDAKVTGDEEAANEYARQADALEATAVRLRAGNQLKPSAAMQSATRIRELEELKSKRALTAGEEAELGFLNKNDIKSMINALTTKKAESAKPASSQTESKPKFKILEVK